VMMNRAMGGDLNYSRRTISPNSGRTPAAIVRILARELPAPVTTVTSSSPTRVVGSVALKKASRLPTRSPLPEPWSMTTSFLSTFVTYPWVTGATLGRPAGLPATEEAVFAAREAAAFCVSAWSWASVALRLE